MIEAPARNAVLLEKGVLVSHGAILHGCILREGALIGIGAIVLDGAVIGPARFRVGSGWVRPGIFASFRIR